MEDAPSPPHIVMPLTFENLMHGETHGVEIAVNWQPTQPMDSEPRDTPLRRFTCIWLPRVRIRRRSPKRREAAPFNPAQLRSHFVISRSLRWDTSAYFVGRLTEPSEPSYTRLDTQLSWLVSKDISLSFVGQNLLKDLHEEFVDSTGSARTTEVKRGAYAKFTWRF